MDSVSSTPQLESVQPSQPAITSQQQPVRQTTSRKRRVVFLMIVMVMILLGASYYMVHSQRKIQSSPAMNSNAKSTIDIKANWKTYSNTEVGFIFRYPATARTTSLGSSDLIETIYDGPSQKKDVLGDAPLSDGYFLRIQWGSNVQTSTLQEGANKNYATEKSIFANASPAASVSELSKTKLAGLDAYTFTMDNVPEYIVQIHGKILIIDQGHAGTSQTDLEYIDTLSQILSTFKVIEQKQAIDTSGWKTLTFPPFNFSVQYPSSWRIEMHCDGIVDPDYPCLLSSDYQYSPAGLGEGLGTAGGGAIVFEKNKINDGYSLADFCKSTRMSQRAYCKQTSIAGIAGMEGNFTGNHGFQVRIPLGDSISVLDIRFSDQNQGNNDTEMMPIFRQILSTIKVTRN